MEPTLRQRIVACIGDALDAMGALEGRAVDEETGLFGEGVGLDSIEALRIVTAVEERFDVAIADEDLDPDQFATVGTLAGFFEERIA